MDIIAKAGFLAENLELTHKVFTEGFGFEGQLTKTVSTYEMDSHGQILVSTKDSIYEQKASSLYLIVSPEKVTKAANILKEAGVPHVIYHENAGDGILATLDWALDNGQSLRLESFEDGYWKA